MLLLPLHFSPLKCSSSSIEGLLQIKLLHSEVASQVSCSHPSIMYHNKEVRAQYK